MTMKIKPNFTLLGILISCLLIFSLIGILFLLPAPISAAAESRQWIGDTVMHTYNGSKFDYYQNVTVSIDNCSSVSSNPTADNAYHASGSSTRFKIDFSKNDDTYTDFTMILFSYTYIHIYRQELGSSAWSTYLDDTLVYSFAYSNGKYYNAGKANAMINTTDGWNNTVSELTDGFINDSTIINKFRTTDGSGDATKTSVDLMPGYAYKIQFKSLGYRSDVLFGYTGQTLQEWTARPVVIDTTAPTIKNMPSYTNSSPVQLSISDAQTAYEFSPQLSKIVLEYKSKSAYSFTQVSSVSTSTSFYNYTCSFTKGDGTYRVTAYDYAGNSYSVTTIYDTIAPDGKLYDDRNQMLNNGDCTNRGFYFKASDSLSGIDHFEYRVGDSNIWNDYISSTVIEKTSLNSTYYFRAVDNAGNISSYNITLDTAKPVIELRSNNRIIASSDIVNNSVTVSANDLNLYSLQVLFGTSDNAMSEIYNAASGEFKTFSAAGYYTVIATDRAGNESTATFCIDQTPPEFYKFTDIQAKESGISINYSNSAKFQLAFSKGFIANYYTSIESDIETIKRINADDTVTAYYLFSDSDFADITPQNGTIFSNGQSFTDKGYYSLMLIDKAGNTSYAYILVWPDIADANICYADGTAAQNQYGFYFKQAVKIEWNNTVNFNKYLSYTATLDHNPYNHSSMFAEEGEHSFTLSDGLNSFSCTIVLDYTAPLPQITNTTHINLFYYTKSSDDSFYAFASREAAENYAISRETALSKQYKYIDIRNFGFPIYPDDNGFVSTATDDTVVYLYGEYLYFTTTSLYKSIQQNAVDSVVEQYLFNASTTKLEYPAYPGENIYKAKFYSKNDLTLSVKSGIVIYVNGKLYENGSVVLDNDGVYEITEMDYAGNSVSYSVVVDKTAPVPYYFNSVGEQAFLLPSTNYYFKNATTFFFEDAEIDTEGSVLYQIVSEHGTIMGFGTSFTFEDPGIYELSLKDSAGNKAIYQIYIAPDDDLNEYISVSFEEVSGLQYSFTATIDFTSKYNNLVNIIITRDEIPVSYDDNVNPITPKANASYYFNTNGEYSITITDVYGRTGSVSLSFTRAAPKGYIYNSRKEEIANGGSSRFRTYVTWSGLISVDAFISGGSFEENTPYTKDTYITEDGTYSVILKLSDDPECCSVYSFTIDSIPPIGYIYTQKNELLNSGDKTNQNVYLTWNEEGLSAFYSDGSLNSKLYSYDKGTIIIAEGEKTITFYLRDKAGNETIYTIITKKTPPVISAYTVLNKELSNNGFTNKNFYFTWKGIGSAFVNGKSYSKDTRISVFSGLIENTYTIVLTDEYGNSSSMSVTLDLTPPQAEWQNFNGDVVQNNSYCSSMVCLVYDDEEIDSAVINKNYSYSSGTFIQSDGSYSIVLTDKAGNKSEYNINIKSTYSELTVYDRYGNPLSDGDIVNSYIYFLWSDANCKAFYSLNGNEKIAYTRGETLNQEGTYALFLYDAANNLTQINITCDFTAPVIQATDSQNRVYDDNSFIKYGFYINFSDNVSSPDKLTCNVEYNNSSESVSDYVYFTAEFTYVFTVMDEAGNSSSFTITIDRTPPVGSFMISASSTLVGEYTNRNFYFTWSDTNCTAQYSFNDDDPLDYKKGNVLRNEGVYRFFLYDAAGNMSEYSMNYIKILPSGTLYNYLSEEIQSGAYLNVPFYFHFDDSLYSVSLSYNNGEASPYINDQWLSDEGTYSLIISDKAGNINQYFVTIDLTPPVGEFFFQNGNAIALSPDSATTYINDKFYFTWVRGDGSSAYYTLNSGDQISYLSGTVLKNEGIYHFYIFDEAGNMSEYSIYLDLTAPSGYFVNENLEQISGAFVNFSVTFLWNNDDSSAVYYINGELIGPYLPSVAFTEEGEYSILLTDISGNSATFNITIDLTPPVGQFYSYYGTPIAGNYTNGNFYFSWDGSATAYLIDDNAQEEYKKGTIIRLPDSYSFLLVDEAGNSTRYSIELIKETPSGQLYICSNDSDAIEAESGTYTNKDVFLSWENDSYIASVQFNSEENSLYENGSILSAEGIYTFKLSDFAGNTSIFIITIDKTAPLISAVTQSSGSITNNSTVIESFYFTWTDDSSASAKINDDAYYIGKLLTKNDTYSIIVTDLAGNSSSFTVTLFNSVPEIHVTTIDGSKTVRDGNTVYKAIMISWDEQAVNYDVKLNGTPISNNTQISEIGTYSLTANDEFGNSVSFVFYLEQAPENEGFSFFEGNKTMTVVIGVLCGIFVISSIIIPLIRKGKWKKRKNRIK